MTASARSDESIDPRVRRYAALLIRVAVNLQHGQRLTVWKAPVDAAPFVRLLTDEAYAAGASYVEVFWRDDQLELLRLTSTSPPVLEARPAWEIQTMESSAEAGGAFLFFDCTCAGVFDNTPAAVVARALALENEHLQRIWQFFVRNTVNWSIVTVPTTSWARKVFPDLAPEDGVAKLWEIIFTTCRVDTEDYAERWRMHRTTLEHRSDLLNRLDLRELRFSGPGTHLSVGLPEGRLWRHPGFTSAQGVSFIADIPIEEIFTLPDRRCAEGIVRSTRPLVVNGRTVGEFAFRFHAGKIVAVEGGRDAKEMLVRMIDENEGADRLGEVAIVPEDSLVALQDQIFYNSIFDENSSSHLALGRAYRFCMHHGEDMDDRTFGSAGGNAGPIHIDFMIGSEELDVLGVTAGGMTVRILSAGRWSYAG